MRRLLLLSLLIIAGLILFIYSPQSDSGNISKVCFDHSCVEVEIADTPQERALGLMYRETLPKNKGMLFIFENKSRAGFWMKNMKFPIDIIWISDEKVVYLERNLQPCRKDPCPVYSPDEKYRYVLEVKANFTLENEIEEGSLVRFLQ